jgi:alpha-ketoglutarate-dependent 2,4-dichlorophenoxyacetate dioxygenase
MRIAYDALDTATKTRIEGAWAHHSIIHSTAKAGFHEWTDEERMQMRPIPRPVVHVHAPTGRKSLCLASHMADLTGFTEKEGNELIDELITRATQDHQVYSHHWEVNDLVVWDNRCMIHRARPYDDLKHTRDMRALRINDLTDVQGVDRAVDRTRLHFQVLGD